MPTTASPSHLRSLQLLLSHQAHATASQTDSFLLRLTKLLSTPVGIDTSLATFGYSLTLLHALLQRRLERQLEKFADEIAVKASVALNPGEAILASFPAPAAHARLARAVEASKKFADLISDYRIFVRLWGLLGIYAWGRATYLNPPKDKAIEIITWIQIAANIAYQYLENGAYLAQHGILNGPAWIGEEGMKRQTRWWVWSSRFWAAHVALEFVRLGYTWKKQHATASITLQDEQEPNPMKSYDEDAEKVRALWWKDAVANGAYAPLTVHWSLEEGCVTDGWVGFFGTVAGFAGLKELWKDTIH
jgi:hypothetical protein